MDIFIGVSQEKALRGHWVSKMASKSIVFALANPVPEILPEAEHSAFSEWSSDKRKQIEAQKLRLNVYHYDWFVYF